jgi:hypothetical protein
VHRQSGYVHPSGDQPAYCQCINVSVTPFEVAAASTMACQ